VALNCLFCQIVSGEMQADVVYRDDALLAFNDINPQAPVHLLIIPRKHIPTLLEVEPADHDVLGRAFTVGKELAKQRGVSDDGFRMVVNCGPGAGQSVYHVHLHLLGGRSMGWPPG